VSAGLVSALPLLAGSTGSTTVLMVSVLAVSPELAGSAGSPSVSVSVVSADRPWLSSVASALASVAVGLVERGGGLVGSFEVVLEAAD
jgi:hypothetical protein